jgi:hypothetical protein
LRKKTAQQLIVALEESYRLGDRIGVLERFCAGYHVYDRFASGYVVRTRTAKGWALALVILAKDR